ncbi:UNVERIFIED_CONTAM: hypothetical protein Slati_2667300 [Sesamum latifolium]|uniref:DUF4283 domain-containing protein n=1 Tax=Sesamum latifolium TaxID=2727402 RepID=A0AAW2VV36_9LAMI
MQRRKQSHTQVPVWIKIKHLPIELWTDEGISIVVSGVGKPLYTDVITKACMRLNFARVCIIIDYQSTLPKHLIVLLPTDEGAEVPCRVDIDYEWVPARCTQCQTLGHSKVTCPSLKHAEKRDVQIYVQKPWSSATVDHLVQHTNTMARGAAQNAIQPMEETVITLCSTYTTNIVPIDPYENPIKEKGKEIVIFNQFCILDTYLDNGKASTLGPEQSSLEEIIE